MALYRSSMICNLKRPSLFKVKPNKYPLVRSHGFHEGFQGNAANRVDSNLHVLRQRMEEMRIRERSHGHKDIAGWAYRSYQYDNSNKGKVTTTLLAMSELTELLVLMGTTVSLVFLSGSLGIFLVSLLVCLYSMIYN